MTPRTAVELPPFFGGVYRRIGEQYGSRGPTGQAVDALNVETAFGEVQRRRALRSFATGPPLLRPPGGHYAIMFLSTPQASQGNFFIASSQEYTYLGAHDANKEPFSGVYFPAVSWVGTIIRPQVLRFEYYNGTDWAPIPWILDQTRAIVGGFDVPIARPGGIYWRVADLTDWADFTINEIVTNDPISTKWVRFRFYDAVTGDLVSGGLTRTIQQPGVQLVDLPPVNGLHEGAPANAEALIVAADRPEQRGQELGGNIGLALEKGRVEPGLLEMAEEDGYMSANDADPGDPNGIPIVGTGGSPPAFFLQLTKVRQSVFDAQAGATIPFEWARGQFAPGTILSDLTVTLLDRIDSPPIGTRTNNWLEHCRGVRDLGDGETELTVITETNGTRAFVYPNWASTENDFSIVSPPMKVILWDAEAARAFIEGNLEHALSLELPGFVFTQDYPFKYYGRFSVVQEMRWAVSRGRRWVFSFNPVTLRVLCANGGEVLETDGRVFRRVPADNDSTLADILAGETPEGLPASEGEVANASRGQFRGAVPNLEFVTFFQGRVWGARGNLIYWTFPNQGVDVWPYRFTTTIRTSESSPITGMRVVGERLLVFTKFETHEVYQIEVHDYTTRPVSQIGFVHQNATVVISNQGASFLAGVTPQGIGLWTGGEVQMILSDWSDIVDLPVNVARLDRASATYVSSTAQAFFSLPVGSDAYARRILVREIDTQRWWVWSTSWGVSELARGTDPNGRDFLLVGYETGFVATLEDDLTDDAAPVSGRIKTAPAVLPGGARVAVTECLVTTRVLGTQTIDVAFFGDEDPQPLKAAVGMRVPSGHFVVGQTPLGPTGRPLGGATYQTQGYRTRGVRVAHAIQGLFESSARWALRSLQVMLLPRGARGRR